MSIDYNKVTAKWHDIHMYSPVARHRRRIVSNILKKLSFVSCIDVGCAQSFLIEDLHTMGLANELYGCDIAQTVIEENQRESPYAHFATVDLEKEVYPNGLTFDVAVCSEVLEHIDNWQKALANLCAMSKQYVLITVPCGKLYHTDKSVGHYRHFHGEELTAELTKNGFSVVSLRKWGIPMHRLYKIVINTFSPDKLTDEFTESTYGFFKKLLCNVLYITFFINYWFHDGDMLFLLAQKEASK